MFITGNNIQDKRNRTERIRAKESRETGLFYDRTTLLSNNCLWNAALGGRGVGKTFDYKQWALFMGDECVWVRRYKEDIDDVKGSFLTDLIAEGFLDMEEHEIKIEDDTLYLDGEPRIHFVPLSTSRRKKSNSFHHVDKIIYDEFLEGYGGRYLTNEYNIFLELYETIARMRDVRVVFIANKTSFVNPYFVEWNVKPFTERIRKVRYGNGLIAIENYNNVQFVDKKKQTAFGKYIAGSEYGNYAIDNEVWLDDNAMLSKREPDSKCLLKIRDREKYIGIWGSIHNNKIFCSWQHNSKIVYTYQTECRERELSLVKSQYPVKQLYNLWNKGQLYFEDNIIKNIMFDILLNGGKRK